MNSTKKKFTDNQPGPAGSTLTPKMPGIGVQPGKNAGQMKGNAQMDSFGETLTSNGMPGRIGGLDGLHNDIGEMSGFATSGYLDKQNTPFGEAAKFNFLPPGMDISNQENAEIHSMPMRILVAESYPGDGWTPTPRDVEE